MDCKKAQQLLDDLSRNRLAEPVAGKVRQHLADCTDCRVTQQRGARLQRLLALKRYERPTPEYFDNFLSEFHGRLRAEVQRPRFWGQVLSKFDEIFALESVRAWRYGFATTVGIAMIVGTMWVGLRQTNQHRSFASDSTSGFYAPITLVESLGSVTRSTPQLIASQLPRVTGSDHEHGRPSTAGSVLVVPSATHLAPVKPRYVLDRIAVTPASYEVASIHF